MRSDQRQGRHVRRERVLSSNTTLKVMRLHVAGSFDGVGPFDCATAGQQVQNAIEHKQTIRNFQFYYIKSRGRRAMTKPMAKVLSAPIAGGKLAFGAKWELEGSLETWPLRRLAVKEDGSHAGL